MQELVGCLMSDEKYPAENEKLMCQESIGKAAAGVT